MKRSRYARLIPGWIPLNGEYLSSLLHLLQLFERKNEDERVLKLNGDIYRLNKTVRDYCLVMIAWF
jgi:hypothetical protein